jgi:multiple sugar transport system permease protein
MYLVLVLFAVIYIYPFLLDIGTAFKTDADATAHPLSPIPQHWVVAAFSELGQQDFPRWLMNSVVVAVFVTAGRVLFDSMAGYALARLRFRGRGGLFAAIIAVMAVPSVVLLIPTFLILKQLGIYNTYPGMILPLITDAAGVFIMRQFFLTVHPSIEEAAKIDGAGIFRTYWSVVLPMARPALLTLMILSFQGSWNNFSMILVAHQSPSLDTLTTGVGRLVSGQLGAGTQYPLQLAAAMAMTIPVAIVFFVFQKYIMRTGEGAVKELFLTSAADEGGQVARGDEGAIIVDRGLYIPAHILDNLGPRPGGLVLIVAGPGGHVVRGDPGVADHDRRFAGRPDAGHRLECRAQLRRPVLGRERLGGLLHAPPGSGRTDGAFDQLAERARVPLTVGHGDADTAWCQHAAQLTGGRFPVRHVIQHVQRQHDVEHAVAQRQRRDVSIQQSRESHRPQHPHRQITPSRPHRPPD